MKIKEMRNRDIVNELMLQGVPEETYTDGEGKWLSRKELIALYMEPLYKARDNAKDILGKDFSKAVSFWKQLRSIDAMDIQDYPAMTDAWRVLVSLLDTDVSDGAFCLERTAEQLAEIFCPVDADKVSAYTAEEMGAFVEECISQFQLSAFTERLVKESTDIIKMSMDNMQFMDDGRIVFDSTEAQHLTGKKIDYDKKNSIMRVVESSEDGISRMLMEKGKGSLTVFMGQQGRNKEEQELIDKRKYNVFLNGVTDIATNKHYMVAFQNPSSCRKANFMFVEAEDWLEVVEDLWFPMIGVTDWDGFAKTFLSYK